RSSKDHPVGSTHDEITLRRDHRTYERRVESEGTSSRDAEYDRRQLARAHGGHDAGVIRDVAAHEEARARLGDHDQAIRVEVEVREKVVPRRKDQDSGVRRVWVAVDPDLPVRAGR